MFFVVVFDSLFRLSHLSLFVNNFFNFIFYFIASSSLSRCLVCDSSFILACTLYSVNTLFNFFSSYTFHIPPGLSSVFNFASVVLATKIILSLRFQIVNIFLVFYLFRTIQTIHSVY